MLRHVLPAFIAGVALALASESVAPAVARAQAAAWRVGSGEVVVVCPLTVGGSFEATTRSLSGQLSVDPALIYQADRKLVSSLG